MIGFIGEQQNFNIKWIGEGLLSCIEQLELIELPALTSLYEAVACHSDILCCSLCNMLVVEPTLYKALVDKYPLYSNRVLCGSTKLGPEYPNNIAYNVGFIGNYAIHNTRYTDPVLKNKIDAFGYEWIHVRQGYSNCMILPVGSKAAITSDRGICKVLTQRGLDVLLIKQGHIKLPGLNYGFIGGASLAIDDSIYLFGSLHVHPDAEPIRKFVRSKGIKLIELDSRELVDIGSIRIIE